jgi:hypothetical protein
VTEVASSLPKGKNLRAKHSRKFFRPAAARQFFGRAATAIVRLIAQSTVAQACRNNQQTKFIFRSVAITLRLPGSLTLLWQDCGSAAVPPGRDTSPTATIMYKTAYPCLLKLYLKTNLGKKICVCNILA